MMNDDAEEQAAEEEAEDRAYFAPLIHAIESLAAQLGMRAVSQFRPRRTVWGTLYPAELSIEVSGSFIPELYISVAADRDVTEHIHRVSSRVRRYAAQQRENLIQLRENASPEQRAEIERQIAMLDTGLPDTSSP